MKTRVLPLRLIESNERERGEFDVQMGRLLELYGDVAEFLPVRNLGEEIPEEADAVLFPQFVGSIYDHRDEVKKITQPIVVLTSEFGTVEMWDWEVATWMRENLGMNVLTPYTLDLGKVIFRAISAKKEMKNGMKFLMFQDDPGEGMQPYIFKRFYWWSQHPEGGQALHSGQASDQRDRRRGRRRRQLPERIRPVLYHALPCVELDL